MLTPEDKEEIKRLVVEAVIESGLRLPGPDRASGYQTPVSLLNRAAGTARVQDSLGRVDHAVW